MLKIESSQDMKKERKNIIQSNLSIQYKRPQEPTRPYPYHEEEVTYENKKAGVRLAGMLTFPYGEGPFPAVILIAGSGPHARDAIAFGHKTMLVLADYLTRHGIAVLRFDKRGCGASTGDFETAIIADFTCDVQVGIEYMKSRKEINKKQIGVIGHSEGGVIASMVAAEGTDLAFAILMASQGVSGEELLSEQSALQARADGETAEEILTGLRFLSHMIACMKENVGVQVAKNRINALYIKYVNSLSVDQKKRLKSSVWQEAYELMFSCPIWFKFFLFFDPILVLKKIKIPVLALFCERDMLVPIKQNLAPF